MREGPVRVLVSLHCTDDLGSADLCGRAEREDAWVGGWLQVGGYRGEEGEGGRVVGRLSPV